MSETPRRAGRHFRSDADRDREFQPRRVRYVEEPEDELGGGPAAFSEPEREESRRRSDRSYAPRAYSDGGVQSPRPVSGHPVVGPENARQYPSEYAKLAAQRGESGRSSRKVGVGVAAAIIAVIACVGVYLYFNPPVYDVTVNGKTVQLTAFGNTLDSVVDSGVVAPKAGNLTAVDGSVLKQGGGHAFTAEVNGQKTDDGSYVVPRGATVKVSDGADVMEEHTETTQTVPHGTASNDNLNYWSAPIHVYSKGVDGQKVVMTGKISGKTAEKVTKQPVKAGYNVYRADTGDDKVIALTFDDGPWPTTTSEILDILKENGAKATFFEIGNQISENASVVKRMHQEGHQIGSHTWDHAAGSGRGVDLTRMTSEEQVQEIEKGFKAIDDVIGTQTPRIMRAPGGNYHGSVVENLGPRVTAEIGWSVDTEDWRRPGVDSIVKQILTVKPGGVVLMHDGGGDRSESVEALRQALPQLKAKGYKFITIDEMLKYPPLETQTTAAGENS